jgi:hypothetical protein
MSRGEDSGRVLGPLDGASRVFFPAAATTIFLSPSSSWPLDSRQRIMERGAMDAHIYTRAELGDHPVYPQESQLTPACDPLVVTVIPNL